MLYPAELRGRLVFLAYPLDSLIHGWDEDKSGRAQRMLINGLGGDLTICDERTWLTFTA
jgi:hypothetical protein